MTAPIQPLLPLDLMPEVTKALEAVKHLPPEQQQAVLEAAATTARASVDLRRQLYMTGSFLANLGKR